jgi:phosphoglycerate dehydrogenase-like enzyme
VTEPWQLRGRTVVITGAGSGIGAEAAWRLAGLGATVAPGWTWTTSTGAVGTVGAADWPPDGA